MKNLLFTAGGSPGQEGLYRYLKKKYNLFFADANIDNISPVIPVKQRIQIPLGNTEAFIPALRTICKKYKIDLLIPGVDEELIKIARESDKFLPTQTFLPSEEFISTMLNKKSMVDALHLHQIDAPLTLIPGERGSKFHGKVILKPQTGRGSRNVYEAQCHSSAKLLYQAVKNDCASWIFQEKIIGEEYTVQVLAKPSSELVAVLPILVEEKRGSTISATMRPDPEIESYCRKIHKALNPGGCYNVQLVKEDNGMVKAFEINPRISTTMVMAVAAGYDPFLNYFTREDSSTQPRNIPLLSLRRHWTNEIMVKV